MSLITQTYTDTGEKPLIKLSDKDLGIKRFTIKAGDSDVFSVDVQMADNSQRVTIPAYKDKSGDVVGRIPYKTFAVGINISANVSASIIFEVQEI